MPMAKRKGFTLKNYTKLPDNLDLDDIVEAVKRHNSSLDNPGFCLACGLENEGCEPDARRYECESCGELAVYGAEECLMMFG